MERRHPIVELPTCEEIIPYVYDRYMESRYWMTCIPSIKFPRDWNVQIIPPFSGALVRFRVNKGSIQDDAISVYLDGFCELGRYSGPYWEIYPIDGHTKRYDMEDIAGLLKGISKGIRKLNKL